jgi:hypothetical protein
MPAAEVVDDVAWMALGRWLRDLDPDDFETIYLDLLEIADAKERQQVILRRFQSDAVPMKKRGIS